MKTYDECAEFVANQNGHKSLEHWLVESQTHGLIYKKIAKVFAFEVAKETLLIAAEAAEFQECNGYPTKDVILNTKINVS